MHVPRYLIPFQIIRGSSRTTGGVIWLLTVNACPFRHKLGSIWLRNLHCKASLMFWLKECKSGYVRGLFLWVIAILLSGCGCPLYNREGTPFGVLATSSSLSEISVHVLLNSSSKMTAPLSNSRQGTEKQTRALLFRSKDCLATRLLAAREDASCEPVAPALSRDETKMSKEVTLSVAIAYLGSHLYGGLVVSRAA